MLGFQRFLFMFWQTDKQKMRRTLEDRWVRRFLHRSAVVRWLIVLGTFGGLIGLALFGGRIDFAALALGQKSPRTIAASVNFSYQDEDATMLERARKAGDTPNVYRLEIETFQRDLGRAQNLVERVAALQQGGKISGLKLRKIAEIWNEGGEVPLSNADIQALLALPDKKGFTAVLAGLSWQLAEKGIVGDDQFPNPETSLELALNSHDLSQLKRARAGQFPPVQQARRRLIEELNAAVPLPKTVVKTVEKIVTDLIVPNLHLDLSLSAKLQEKRRQGVEPVYRQISKGNVLIELGERLTENKLAMLRAHQDEVDRNFSSETRWRQRAGTGALVALIIGAAILVLTFQKKSETVVSNREYGLLAVLIILHLGICRLILYFADVFGALNPSLTSSILPYCFGPILVAVLIHRWQAHLTAFICSFLLGVITQFNFAVMLTSLVSAIVGIHFSSLLRRRAQIYEAGLFAGGSAALANMIFGLMWDVPWRMVGTQSGAAIAAAFAASLLVSALLPIFESLFRVTTDLRWLEMSDLNHPLLRRMVMEAPGTYHHSLVVSNLSERACEEIGAHALQARVCSYFHDIGKLNNPDYFCENQPSDRNPHDDIAPNMSALIIMAHVKDGVDMAIQHRLARSIIDTIQRHHGTGQIAYFYRLAKRYQEDAMLGGKIMRLNVSDVPRVEEETYRYPGPKPFTREIAVISLADAVEGASRCMLKPTPQKIEALIAEIIEDRFRDGQLDDCSLTLRELRVVAGSFSKTLLSMLHARISYPKDEPIVDQSASIPSAAAS